MTNQVVIDPEEQNQDAYDNLIVSIEASVGNLNLLIAVCDYPRFRDEIIARYENELTPNFHCYHVTLARGEPSLKAAINELVQQKAYLRDLQPAVITVTGIG